MDKQSFDSLREGDIVRNVFSGQAGIVVASTCDGHPIVSRTMVICNPVEWSVEYKAAPVERKEAQ